MNAADKVTVHHSPAEAKEISQALIDIENERGAPIEEGSADRLQAELSSWRARALSAERSLAERFGRDFRQRKVLGKHNVNKYFLDR